MVAVKYLNKNHDPSITLATWNINRESVKKEGMIMSIFKNSDSIAEIYAGERYSIYMKYFPDSNLRDQLDLENVNNEK